MTVEIQCRVDGCQVNTRSTSGYCKEHKKKRMEMINLLETKIPGQFQDKFESFSYAALEIHAHESKRFLKAIKDKRYRI